MSNTKIETLNTLRSQPRPILKKSPARAIKKPVFFTASDSICSLDSDDSESTTYNANILNDSIDEEDRFKISSFGKKSPIKSVSKKRKPLSPLYIFHSTEINKEIIKMLLTSTDNFLEEFKRTISNPNFSDKDLIKLHSETFLPKLKDFITGDENNLDRFYDRMHAFEIGATLSEPISCEVEKYRLENRKQKLKESHSSSRIDKQVLESTLGIAGNTHKQIECGSLPARSFFDSYNKELKNKEEILLKTIRSKSIKTSNEENLLFSQAATNKSVKDKNKCIVSAATSTKKMVRFADAFGLDLENVKIISNNSFVDAFSYSQEYDNSENEQITSKIASKPFLVLIPLFAIKKSSDASPIKMDDFIFDYENKLIKCVVKVKNLSYNKRVFARITFNNWKKYHDLEAIYVKSDPLNISQKNLLNQTYSNDYFAFCIIIPEKNNTILLNENPKQTPIEECTLRIEFALCFEQNGLPHWDNNSGENYKFQCFYNMN